MELDTRWTRFSGMREHLQQTTTRENHSVLTACEVCGLALIQDGREAARCSEHVGDMEAEHAREHGRGMTTDEAAARCWGAEMSALRDAQDRRDAAVRRQQR